MKAKQYFILSVICLFAISAKSSEISDEISPEIFDSISVEANLISVQNSLQSKTNGYPVVADEWMIVTANAYASIAGAEILSKGGTAADAMVAAQSVLGLVEPESSGLGGGGFLVWYDSKTKKITTLDGRETAPLKSKVSQFQNKEGESMEFFDAVVGGLSVGTPGMPALMYEAQKRWGNQKWEELFTYSINLSENGFLISNKLASSVERDRERLKVFKLTRDYFFPDNISLKKGDTITNPAYGNTLKKIAVLGINEFYAGSIADDIIDTVKNAEKKGFLDKEDLNNYRVIERKPVCIDYKDYDICGMGPPSSGGIAVAQVFKILENFEIRSLNYSDPILWQIVGDAMQLAFADRGLYLADSDFTYVPITELIDVDYLEKRANKITVGKKTDDISAGNPITEITISYAKDISIELPSTTHISIVDKYGNALSMTSSVENAFGSRLMTNSGFLLNNQLTDFSFQHEINGKLIANRLEPGKRPRSSMSPTIVLKDGSPVLVIGSPGGSNIIGFVVNAIIGFIEWDLNVQEIVSMPHAINKWGKYEIENSIYANDLEKNLSLMGYETKIRNYFSGLNAIYIGDKLEGGSDPRREGIALGDYNNK